MRPEFVVAIDGPAGAGKSTVARRVARILPGFRYLDTGAMYRAVTCYLQRHGRLDVPAEAMAADAATLETKGDRLYVHGEEVTDGIRTPEVTAEVSRVSAVPAVRRVVQAKQRDQEGRLVVEGRDIGTVVYPDAQVKIYLTAALPERVRRRHGDDKQLDVEEVERLIVLRDRLDSEREDSPLRKPDGADEIDTTDLTIEEVVEKVAELVRAHLTA